MLGKVITVALLIVGLINFLPVMGLFSVERMESLYGVSIGDDLNLAILMQHRALLFGLVGGFILLAAFVPSFQPAAFILGLVSMLGFILIAWLSGDYNPQILKIIWVDVVGLISLAVAVVAWWVSRSSA